MFAPIFLCFIFYTNYTNTTLFKMFKGFFRLNNVSSTKYKCL